MLDSRAMSAHGAVDLSVRIGSLQLSNPIIAASGTFGYGIEFAHLVDLNQLGGIVTKGLSVAPMAGAAEPRLCETPAGMLNAVGLQNIGVRAFLRDKLPGLRLIAHRSSLTCSAILSMNMRKSFGSSRMRRGWQHMS